MTTTKTTINKTCECGKGFETEHDEAWPMLTDTHCPECTQIIEDKKEADRLAWQQQVEAEQREQAAIARVEKADGITPERIRLTDTADPRFNAKLWEQVQAWQPTADKPWLGLIGDPGECKTRCAFLRLRQLARASTARNFSCGTISGMDFCALVMQQYDRTKTTISGNTWGDGFRTRDTTVGAIAAGELSRLREVGILVFDELGKVKPTPGTVGEFFSLIDYRHANNLVTLWTSNAEPEAFCAAWPTEYAGPGCGRILESSHIIRA